ncbi:hypothetical protein [Aliivibrio kagoshimensis]|uniref:hypothetical protein n=1 Tax=Aliivibrio kagoshimensis TaxID=2910230 RepID=UPI003D0B672E
MFPDSFWNEDFFGYLFLSVMLVSSVLLLVIPTLIVILNKWIDGKVIIILMSLIFPLIGGVFSYFMLLKQFKDFENQQVKNN